MDSAWCRSAFHITRFIRGTVQAVVHHQGLLHVGLPDAPTLLGRRLEVNAGHVARLDVGLVEASERRRHVTGGVDDEVIQAMQPMEVKPLWEVLQTRHIAFRIIPNISNASHRPVVCQQLGCVACIELS